MARTIVDNEDTVTFFDSKFFVHRLEPLQKKRTRHPSLLIVSVNDGESFDVFETPRLFRLANHEEL